MFHQGDPGVAELRDKMREHRLRWFGHEMRRSEEDMITAIPELRVEGRRDRGRPKLTWEQGDTVR